MRLALFLFSLCLASALPAANPSQSPTEWGGFLQKNCHDCHTGADAEAGLDLTQLSTDLAEETVRKRWVRIFDRVERGEMPPPEYATLQQQQKQAFLTTTEKWLLDSERKRYQSQGRVQARRLTNLQLERSLHDLLGIDIPLANLFPEEQLSHRYATVADGQPMSKFQLERHLEAVDLALDEAIRRAVSKPDEFTKSFDGKGLSRRNPKARNREPELIDNHGVIWASRLIFYGRLPVTRAAESGWYRIKVRAKALNCPKDHGVWCTVQTGLAVSSAPLMNWAGSFEATRETQEWTFEAWLEKGDMFEIRPGDTTLKQARFRGGQVGAGEGGPQKVPGIAMERIVLERFHQGPDNAEIRETLFGDLQVVPNQRDWRQAQLKSTTPKQDLRRLLSRFAESAFRRPVEPETVAPYIALAEETLGRGESLIEALRVGYRAILCSPRFLYFYENSGELDDFAMASRLSYFLWNRPPDTELLDLAAQRKLQQPEVLQAQVRRMINDERGEVFVQDFAAEWLDLRLIDFTTPDRRLYRTFDDVTKHSMLDETHAFLQTMLDKNMSVTQLVDSDFTFVNSRLARYYGVKPVQGDELRRIRLDPKSQRGGLLGQGAILKVTANGTTTSPVVRGVWVLERILGEEVPAPPPNVPAIDPDIRGAKSIRDQLAKHRSIESCAACHKHIDPPGFALENFDPAGLWRTRYGQRGAKIDPSYTLADGRKFNSLNEYRKLLTERPAQLAHNVASQLLMYGTGAEIGFADRKDVDRIVQATANSDYGFASIVESVVTSRTFRHK